MRTQRRRLVEFAMRAGLSLGVSLLLLVLIYRLVNRGDASFDQADLFRVLGRVVVPLVFAYLLCQLLQTWLRAERYRILLRGGGEAEVPGRFHLFLVAAVRNMLVDMLPARAGELSYIAMLNRGYRVSGQTCVSSLGISLLFDFIALLCVLGVAFALPLLASEARGALLTGLVGLVLVILVGAFILFFGVRWGLAVVRRLTCRLPVKLAENRLLTWALGFGDDLVQAIDATRTAGVLIPTFLLSLGVRVGKYAGLYFLFLAVTRPSFPALSQAPFWGVLTALLAAEGAASLPLPSFMSFGTYEAGGLLALKLLGFSAADSAVTMFAMHIISQLIDYSVGGLALVYFTMAGPGASRRSGRGWQRAVLAAAVVTGCVGVSAGAGLFLHQRQLRKMGATEAPPTGEAVSVSRALRNDRRDAVRDLEGFMVWSSNRYGNHEVVLLSLPNLKLRRLTNHPHVDAFARIGPDGKRIVFSRSREPWVSQRREAPWDVYLYDLDTGNESRVAEWGYAPSWSEDGQLIYFQREGTTVVEHDPATGRERVLFESGKAPVPRGCNLQTPSVNRASGRLAATLRGRRREVGLYGPDGEAQRISGSGACQLTWAPDGSYLCFMDRGGKMRNMVFRYRVGHRRPEPWLDLPEPFSHEYFPRVSNDGKYLVLGASEGGHEHDTEDYEIFLWRIGATPDAAVRISFHTGNDCWPDLYIGGR